MARFPNPDQLLSQSLNRSKLWNYIRRLALDGLRREALHRSQLNEQSRPNRPSLVAMLAALASRTPDGQLVTRTLSAALRDLFPDLLDSTSRRVPLVGRRAASRRDRVLMLLAAHGPMHARQIAEQMGAELPQILYLLTDTLRDSGELEQVSGGLWGLSATGWREVRLRTAARVTSEG